LRKHGCGKLDSLAAIPNTGAEEKRTQVLFDRARANLQLARDFFIAAALHQQIQYLLIAGRDLDFIKINHLFTSLYFASSVRFFGGVPHLVFTILISKLFAKHSPWVTKRTPNE
jgi:hypothetical protein